MGRAADALVSRLAPGDPLWLDAELAHLGLEAQRDPHAAELELSRIPNDIWKKYEHPLDLFELDLLAFRLHDPSLPARATQIAFANPGTNIPEIAKVRVGDLDRLTGDFKRAVAEYRQAGPLIDPRVTPAQDRAFSITISDYLDDSHRDEAAAKLTEWETRHPMAKFGSDFLLLRARVLLAYGIWDEALCELESFEKTQPDSSFAIDADFYRARALYELGRKDEARKIWNGIVRNYPNHDLAQQCKDWAAKP